MTVGGQKTTFVFEPDRYTGKKNQVVVPGDKLDPKTASTVVVEKEGKGPRLRLGDVALLDGEAAGGGPRRLLRGLAQVLQARVDAAGLRLEAARGGAPRLARRRGRGADLAHVQARGRVRPPARSAGGRARAGERGLALQVGPRNRPGTRRRATRARTSSSSGCPRASTRSSTACAPTWPGRSGRPGDGPVDVRAGVRGVLGARCDREADGGTRSPHGRGLG